MLQLLQGPDKGQEREREKSPEPGGNGTHDLMSFCSRGMYSIAVLQLLPINILELNSLT